MTELRIEPFVLPSAHLGPENPLPVIDKAADLHADIKTDETFPPEERENLGWGLPPSMLPYRFQDGFDRARDPHAWKAVILENEHLKAVFLPELGGHLWSLVSKDSGKELLSSNPVFQPCNLAIRKAWLSGGVEWNLGWTGHWPLTCSPLFAARHTLPDGTPALRMWEFERVRRMPLQIDAWLPAGSRALYVRISIRNANAAMSPVYWWSNIAAEQHPDTRVLVSADEVLLYNYATNAMGCSKLPVCGGDDILHPGRRRGSRDSFFRVPKAEPNPWIAAIQPDGSGLFQTSTSRLRGRKLFRWGIQQGGDNWQKYLASPDYIEIQAGLARTQSHHLPMPAGETWTWVEAYGEITVDKTKAFGDDWAAARAEGERAVRAIAPGETLEALLRDSAAWADAPLAPDTLVGSGWGALEEKRRALAGEPALGLPGAAFPADSLGPDQAPWLALLEGGILEERDPLAEPGCFAPVEFLEPLERSFARPGGRNAFSLFHHGVLLWQAGRPDDAIAAWRASCEATENPWARRCVGKALRLAGKKDEGREDLLRAQKQLPSLRPLRIEALEALFEDGLFAEAVAFADALPEAAYADGRVRLLKARSLVGLGRLDEAESLVLSSTLPIDMREGESGFSDVWFAVQAHRAAAAEGRKATEDEIKAAPAKYTAPAAIDYRMGG